MDVTNISREITIHRERRTCLEKVLVKTLSVSEKQNEVLSSGFDKRPVCPRPERSQLDTHKLLFLHNL